MTEGNSDTELIGRLAEEYLDRYRRGEQPSLREYTRQHPELADRIGELFPLMLKMEDAILEEPATLEQHPTQSPAAGMVQRRLGDYLILREIGRGGMGVVYEAEQISLGRRVAVKTLPAQVVDDETLMDRFRREARAAASLHHTNIVPVYEVGQDHDTMYYAMQLIRGEPLNDVLRELRGHRQGSARASSPAESGSVGHGPQPTTAALAAQSLLAGVQATGEEDDESQAFDFTAPTRSSDEPLHATESLQASGESSGPDDFAASVDSVRMSLDTTGSSSAVLPGASEVSNVEDDIRPYFRSVAHLGVQVADALACAHEKEIIHRDIKPSNLLLDTHGKIWITDFGIAKTGGDDLTHTGDLLGTLRYMAPERFRGGCDPSSDVYSLGITLYEMLALQPAYDEQDRLKLIHRISHEDPPRLKLVDPRVPSDLETIVFKAIQREPERRYRSARELRDDLQRFLEDRPIAARHTSRREQVWRWCRRNPAVAMLTGTLATLLVVLAVASTAAAFHFRQIAKEREDARDLAVQREAESHRNFRMARDAVDQYLIQVSEDPRLESSGLETLRRDLLETAQGFYAQLVELDSSDPELRAEQGRAFRSLASITKELGSLEEASSFYRRSEEILRELSREHPDVPEYREALAKVCSDLGNVLRETERLAEAEAAYDEAFALRRQLTREHPDNLQYRDDLQKIYNNLAVIYFQTGRNEQSESAYREALRLVEQLSESDPENHDYRLSLGRVKNNLGVFYFHAVGRHEAAEKALRTAIEVHQQLTKSHPSKPGYQLELALSLRNLGDVLRAAKRETEAEAAYHESLEMGQRLAADHPDVPHYQAAVITSLYRLGIFHEALDQREQAEARFQQAVELGQQLAADYPDMPKGQMEAAHALYHLGEFYNKAGRKQEAKTAYSALVEVKDRLRQINPETAVFRRELSSHLTALGLMYKHLKQYDLAEETLTSAVEMRERLATEFPDDTYYQIRLGGSYVNLGSSIRRNGRTNDALPWYDQAVPILRTAHRQAPDDFLGANFLKNALIGRAYIFGELKRTEESLADYRSAIEMVEKMAKEHPDKANWPQTLQRLYFNVSIACEDLKRYEEADQAFAATRAALEQLVRDYPDSVNYQYELGRKLYYIGLYLRLRGQAEDALEWERTAIETLAPLHEHSPEDQKVRKYLRFAYYERARSHDALGNEDEAAAARALAKGL